MSKYSFSKGSYANGIDFPENYLNTDMKVTSIRQPQSSCPFKSAKQKIFGLGYNLLFWVYEKFDYSGKHISKLNFFIGRKLH